jgi:hypothetical protein
MPSQGTILGQSNLVYVLRTVARKPLAIGPLIVRTMLDECGAVEE